MSNIPTLPNIQSKMVRTARLNQHVLMGGDAGGAPVLCLHGNASSAVYWEEIISLLPAGFRGIALDLRGYGETDDVLIDATRGHADWVDDALSLMDTLGIEKFHVAGHSMGGGVVFALIAAAPQRILTATVVAPTSPFGFGGTKGDDGAPCCSDFAGSGGGIVNPAFPQLIAAGDRSSDNPQLSPRVVMNSFYWKPPFKPAREEELLSGLLSEKIGPDKYPGDFETSPNWPGVRPGVRGPVNAFSPKFNRDMAARLIAASPKPPVLWVRGDSDQIVADMSLFDFGTLGKLGIVPGWPGDDVFPPQPMVSQTRAVLKSYAANGGAFDEVVFAECGHSPQIEKPSDFIAALVKHMSA